MTIHDPKVGDVVRVDGDVKPWRVTGKNGKTGMLTLEALHSYVRVVWAEVHEFRVQRAGAFR